MFDKMRSWAIGLVLGKWLAPLWGILNGRKTLIGLIQLVIGLGLWVVPAAYPEAIVIIEPLRMIGEFLQSNGIDLGTVLTSGSGFTVVGLMHKFHKILIGLGVCKIVRRKLLLTLFLNFLLVLVVPTQLMGSGSLNFRIERGATFLVDLTWKDANDAAIDLTGYTAVLQIRENTSSATVILELSTANGKITLGGAAGTIEIKAPDTDTTALPLKFAKYDLLMTAPTGDKTRLVEGTVDIRSEITQ